MTLYEDLGAAPTATRAELRRAFVDAARRSHPDTLHGADRAYGRRGRGADAACE